MRADKPYGEGPLSASTKFMAMPVAARVVVGVFGAVGIIELLVVLGGRPSMIGELFFLMLALAVVTSRAKVRLPGGSTLSLLTSVVLSTLMLLGTEATVLVGMMGVVVQSSFPWRRRVPYRILFN